MKPRREVIVTVSCEPIEVTIGEWCAECALPSVANVVVVTTIGQCASIETCHYCSECCGWTYDR